MGNPNYLQNFKINFLLIPILIFINIEHVNSLNITKCCKSNEIIHISKSEPNLKPSCKELNEKSPQWKPFLYKNPQERVNPEEEDWEETTINYLDEIENVNFSKIVFQRGQGTRKGLSAQNSIWRHSHWRLLRNASVELVAIIKDRQWSNPIGDSSFCVDGLYISEPENNVQKVNYVEDENNQILLLWETNPDITSNCTFHNIHNIFDYQTQARLYAGLAFISAFFDFMTFILILFSKSYSNGWTILGLVGTSCIKQILTGVCKLISTLDASYENTWISWGLAVSLHFFALSAFIWIPIMSFDLMKAIRSRILIREGEDQLLKFSIYSLIAWVFPLVLVSAFATLDYVYIDPLTQVIVPEYGVHNLFIVDTALGLYFYYIIIAILLINLIFTTSAACFLCKLKQNQRILNQEGYSSSFNSGFISFRLCLKLFILTGSVWAWELISWFDTGSSNPWYYMITDALLHLQSLWMFLIFVCNARTMKKLMEKYNKTRGSIFSLNFNIADFSRSRSNSQETQVSE